MKSVPPSTAAESVARTTSAGLNAPGGPARGVPETSPRLRVLYVDDDALLRRFCAEVLICAGYEVELASDGVEAWALLQSRSYDLLITDNQMPRLTGLELLEKMQMSGNRLPSILASGSFAGHEMEDWPSVAGTVLNKPFRPEQLLLAVRQLLQLPPAAVGHAPTQVAAQGKPAALGRPRAWAQRECGINE